MSYSHLAGVYDRFAYDFDYDAWTDWYLKLINTGSVVVKEICDCGCGTGSISVRLARKGYRLTGIDVSEDMLAEAQKKARAAGLRIPFIRQDMRKLSLPHKTDAIICACDGVNYLLNDRDVLEFFKSAFAALKPGGVLAFDISNTEKLTDSGLYAEDMEEQTYLWQNEFDSEKRLLHMRLALFIREKDGRYAKYTEEHVQKAHRLSEIQALLEKAGFGTITHVGDDYGTHDVPGGKRIYFTAVKD